MPSAIVGAEHFDSTASAYERFSYEILNSVDDWGPVFGLVIYVLS